VTRFIAFSPALSACAVLAACGAPSAAPDAAAPAQPAVAETAYPVERDALGPYRALNEAHGLVFVSGLTAPAGPDGRIGGDLEDQTGAALRLLAEALAEDNLTLGDVAHLTIHVVQQDAAADADGIARAMQRAFATRLQPEAPARSVVAVSGFPDRPGARVMLSATASRPPPASPQAPDADTK